MDIKDKNLASVFTFFKKTTVSAGLPEETATSTNDKDGISPHYQAVSELLKQCSNYVKTISNLSPAKLSEQQSLIEEMINQFTKRFEELRQEHTPTSSLPTEDISSHTSILPRIGHH